MIACFFSYSFIFVVAVSGRGGVLSSFCVAVFLLFFPRAKGYFILFYNAGNPLGVKTPSP